MTSQPEHQPASEPNAETWPDTIGTELRGDMRCARCGYNLRGLSIVGECPECGMPVSTTLLFVVDPNAKDLQPLLRPKLVAAGVAVWSAGGVVALLGAWVSWGMVIAGYGAASTRPGALVCMFGIGMSMLGSLMLVRPHATVPIRGLASAVLGVLLHVPLAWLAWSLLSGVHIDAPRALAVEWPVPAQHSLHRLAACVVAAAMALALRPNARDLALRSLMVRRKQVDRQTLMALASAIGVLALGDGIRLISLGLVPEGDAAVFLRAVALAVVMVGSMLVTVGMLGVAMDSFRLAPVLAQPPLALSDVLTRPEPEGTRAEAEPDDA